MLPFRIQKTEMNQKPYNTPVVRRVFQFHSDRPVMAGSIVDSLNVETTGQETSDIDFSDNNTFNHQWQ